MSYVGIAPERLNRLAAGLDRAERDIIDIEQQIDHLLAPIGLVDPAAPNLRDVESWLTTQAKDMRRRAEEIKHGPTPGERLTGTVGSGARAVYDVAQEAERFKALFDFVRSSREVRRLIQQIYKVELVAEIKRLVVYANGDFDAIRLGVRFTGFGPKPVVEAAAAARGVQDEAEGTLRGFGEVGKVAKGMLVVGAVADTITIADPKTGGVEKAVAGTSLAAEGAILLAGSQVIPGVNVTVDAVAGAVLAGIALYEAGRWLAKNREMVARATVAIGEWIYRNSFGAQLREAEAAVRGAVSVARGMENAAEHAAGAVGGAVSDGWDEVSSWF